MISSVELITLINKTMNYKIELTREELTTILQVATGNVKDFVMDNDKFINKHLAAINYTHSCKSVKNTDNETPLEKIKVLTNTLETFRNIPYTTDAITKAIKKIDKLISKL